MKDLHSGWLMVLDRSHAKTLFGCRTPDDCRRVVQEILADSDAVDCGEEWQSLHEALAAAPVPDSVLGHCFLDGRPLPADAPDVVRMVRPDIVRAVAQQCEALDPTAFAAHEQRLQAVTQLFSRAAESGSAVVFATQG